MHGAAFPSFVFKSRMQSKPSQVNAGWTQTCLSLAWLDISSLAKPPHTTSSVVSRWQEATVNRQPTGKSDSCNPLGLFICWNFFSWPNLHGIYVCDSNKQSQQAAKTRGVPGRDTLTITSAVNPLRHNWSEVKFARTSINDGVRTSIFAEISPFPFDRRPALFRRKYIIPISLNL